MATPRSDSYTAASGATVAGGRGSSTPTWMSNAVVGQWSALPNSVGVGGSGIDAFSAFVVDDDLNLWVAAAGGHSDSSDNRVVRYAAGISVPTGWQTIKAPSSVVQQNVAYYNDGLPVSRHTYNYTYWHAGIRRILLIGATGIYINGGACNTIDGFNVDTGEWDSAGTYPYTFGSSLSFISGYNYGACQDKATGNIFFNDSVTHRMWVPGTQTLVNKGNNIKLARFPNCWDSSRNAIFGLQWGDSQGFGAEQINAHQSFNPSSASPTTRDISFNASAGLSNFVALRPNYPGMDYDELRDKFMFACGTVGTYGTTGPVRIYEITPNASSTWDMSVYTPSGGVTPGGVNNGGLNGRFRYVRRGSIGGFLFIPSSTAGLYFLRTA